VWAAGVWRASAVRRALDWVRRGGCEVEMRNAPGRQSGRSELLCTPCALRPACAEVEGFVCGWPQMFLPTPHVVSAAPYRLASSPSPHSYIPRRRRGHVTRCMHLPISGQTPRDQRFIQVCTCPSVHCRHNVRLCTARRSLYLQPCAPSTPMDAVLDETWWRGRGNVYPAGGFLFKSDIQYLYAAYLLPRAVHTTLTQQGPYPGICVAHIHVAQPTLTLSVLDVVGQDAAADVFPPSTYHCQETTPRLHTGISCRRYRQQGRVGPSEFRFC
jgi:hypothetical protein